MVRINFFNRKCGLAVNYIRIPDLVFLVFLVFLQGGQGPVAGAPYIVGGEINSGHIAGVLPSLGSHKISWEISETPLQLGGVSIEVCDEIQKESLYDARYPDWLAHLIWMKLHFKASVGPIGVRDC